MSSELTCTRTASQHTGFASASELRQRGRRQYTTGGKKAEAKGDLQPFARRPQTSRDDLSSGGVIWRIVAARVDLRHHPWALQLRPLREIPHYVSEDQAASCTVSEPPAGRGGGTGAGSIASARPMRSSETP